MVVEDKYAAGNDPLAQEFVQFAVDTGALRFGEFKTKAGRLSPYFFNAGLFDDGAKLGRLAAFYARCIQASGIEFDMLFGPAYKGIPLGAAVAVELARQGRNVPFAYNRKEAKDHGEGGVVVGAPLRGRVLIVDDVISAGTSVRESVKLLQAAGARPCGVLIALDRQERATEGEKDMEWSAVPPRSWRSSEISTATGVAPAALIRSTDSRTEVPAEITSSMISTRPLTGAPTSVPPSPWSLASLRL